jgi:RHS repeat-associated protein
VAQEAPLLAQRGADWADATHWHFEPDGFRPLARQDAGARGEAAGRTLYVVNDHLGTPRELVDERGAAAWSAALSLWGGTRALWRPAAGRRTASLHAAALAEPGETLEGADLCPIRFQGQWEDEETGLYYNRFRHYDPLAAQYVSPDPIGIFGSARASGYVISPTRRIDPLGLTDPTGVLPTPTGKGAGGISSGPGYEGNRFGYSTLAGGNTSTHPVVKDLYDQVPDGIRDGRTGHCAETDILSGLAREHDVKSASQLRDVTKGSTMKVWRNDGKSLPPCPSCAWVQRKLECKGE